MIRIGKLVATHGLDGSMILTHIAGKSTWLKKDATLFVEMQKESFIPHFVSSFKAAHDGEYIVNIEGLDNVNAAKKLVAKHVYVDESLIASFAKSSPLLWIGFKICDKTLGEVGTIEDVMKTGNQWLAKITYKNNEALIPLIDEMIEALDLKGKKIKMDLPDGLLEIYASNNQ